MQRGPPDSPYAGGEYHGQLLFPAEYPFKPPGIKVCGELVLWDRELIASFQMLTPSGRFYPDKKICFSMSDFHPGSVRDRRLARVCPADHLCHSGIPHGVYRRCMWPVFVRCQHLPSQSPIPSEAHTIPSLSSASQWPNLIRLLSFALPFSSHTPLLLTCHPRPISPFLCDIVLSQY